MLSDLEKKRKQVELKKVEAAMAEMEFTILEREADIERLKKNITIQMERIVTLTQELSKE